MSMYVNIDKSAKMSARKMKEIQYREVKHSQIIWHQKAAVVMFSNV